MNGVPGVPGPPGPAGPATYVSWPSAVLGNYPGVGGVKPGEPEGSSELSRTPIPYGGARTSMPAISLNPYTPAKKGFLSKIMGLLR